MSDQLGPFLDREGPAIRVRVVAAHGSVPRGEGTEMAVSRAALHGTIGGGRLEHMAVEAAREMLAANAPARRLDVPLGPGIGQCCGGRVALALDPMDAAHRAEALAREAQLLAARPAVLVFGAGHVGRALARSLAPLPVAARLIDPRAGELALCDAPVARLHTPLPEAELRAAPPGAAVVIATHDHGLDFLLAAEALSRADAAYVGLIGSATKRARFHRAHPGFDPARLTCPIGAAGQGDKRPEVIAAFCTAEILSALARISLPTDRKAPA